MHKMSTQHLNDPHFRGHSRSTSVNDESHFRQRLPEATEVDSEMVDKMFGKSRSFGIFNHNKPQDLAKAAAAAILAVGALAVGTKLASPEPSAESLAPASKAIAAKTVTAKKSPQPTELDRVQAEADSLVQNFDYRTLVAKKGEGADDWGRQVDPQFYTGPESSNIDIEAVRRIVQNQVIPPYKTIQPGQIVAIPAKPPTSYPDH
jgi:hypothetical protein